MEKFMNRILRLIFALVLLFSIPGVFASNGYFSHGYGTPGKGMAGAGIALHLGNLGSANNPAAMVFNQKGFEINLAAFMPFREYKIGDGDVVESDSKFFPVPSLGANWIINETIAVNVAVYGNGGMNTNYDAYTYVGQDELGNPVMQKPTGVNLSQLFTGLSVARKLGENHSIGVSFILGYQMFEAEGLLAFAGSSSDAENFNKNGTDNSTGYGYKI